MKKVIITLSVLIVVSFSIFAQAPKAFKYQAIARNTSGVILSNKAVSLRVSIIEDTTVRYIETHYVISNQFGLINIKIGTGSASFGTFATINWGSNKHFVQVDMDESGGNNFQTMGVAQLLSVPYALYAEKAGNDNDADSTNELQVISISNDTIILSNGGFVKLPAVQTGSVPSNTCLQSNSITPPQGYTYTGDYTTMPNTNVWVKKANMSYKVANGPGVVAVKNKIYAMGGQTGATVSSKRNEEYDPATNSWTVKANMPDQISNFVAVEAYNKIYVFGGWIDGASSPSNKTEEYNPLTNTWTTKANMPTTRYRFAGSSHNNKIYVFGGQILGGITNANEEYDPLTNTWVTKANLPTERSHLNACNVNGIIYVLGGGTISNPVVNTNEAYDPATNTWSIKAGIPTARKLLAVSVVNDKIYAIGGKLTSSTATNKNEEYDPVTNTWKTMQNMPTARGGCLSAVVNNKIYVIGGGLGYGSENEVYTPPKTYYIHCKN